uniref:DNA methylase N-4/N-6 domain-containing protein n=1 Tax=Coccolithus braarudii TaxID=221442 RepID=A0A7S0L5U9_9EUKA
MMEKAGTYAKSYAFDEHVGRHNVFHIDKDDCHKKPYATVQRYFADKRSEGKCCSTFDYKPEALMRALIRDYTKPEHTVVDLCMRHGITAVAAELEQRSCIGIEIEKQSYSLAVGRFKDQFGYTSTTTTPVRASPVATAPLPVPLPAAADPLPDATVSAALLPDALLSAALLPVAPLVSRIDMSTKSLKKHYRMCGTPGCTFPDNHIGLCSCATVGQKRTRNALEA